MSRPRLDQPFVKGSISTPAGELPQVSGVLEASDHCGTFKARWGVGRMNYTVDPGLYALGNPDHAAPVFVTANYKMSFDALRSAVPNRNAWILALDTDGINVWCAAGKGTFGTEELLSRIASSELTEVVSHKRLILPQLAAPGVAAHEVKRRSGFRVIYGPITARDLPAFVDAGFKATPEMRRKTFTLRERVELIPIELVAALKPLAIILPVVFLLGGLLGSGSFWASAMDHGLFAVAAMISAVFTGTILTQILLPWLPGRAFALKGALLGAVVYLLLAGAYAAGGLNWSTGLELVAWLLIATALTAYLAMNFTGASTYTSLSGVRREMRLAVPLEIAAAAIGLCLWLGTLFLA
ncbi:MAG: acetyl-CoA synthase subunit gamma [Desulfomonile tiedjei]|nr:acetyl-CoA synthase subunit gamma [Desulfomonile tiedjei]